MFGSLSISVSGISAQDAKMAGISANIANSSTPGYKGIGTAFSTLLDGYEHGGGVVHKARPTVSIAGRLESSQIVTDIAVEGDGMIAVNSDQSGKGETLYTREGSFRKDKDGNLRNIAGSYLMALPSSVSANSLSMDALQVVNLDQGIGDVSATKNISIALNLQATESPAKGISYTLSPNVGFDPDILIYDQKLRVMDGIEFEIGTDTYTAAYGGLCAGASPLVKDVFGAKDTKSEMTSLREGDGFVIIDDGGTKYEFKFKKGNVDFSHGEFNSLQDLSAAIDSTSVFKSSIVNDVLCIAPLDPFAGMRFDSLNRGQIGVSNLAVDQIYGVQQFYDNKTSIGLATTHAFGVSALADKFTSGASAGDGISIVMSNGNKYKLSYNPATTGLAANEFNSLAGLATAITSTIPELVVTQDTTAQSITLSVKPGTGVSINSILDTGSAGSNFATIFKLNLDTQFNSSGAQAGDKMTIDFGAYTSVRSVPNNNYVYRNSITVIGSEAVSKSVGATAQIMGAASISDAFTDTTIHDLDGIKITSDKGDIVVRYKATSPTVANGEFNSMLTFVDAVKAVGNSIGVDAKVDGGSQINIFAIGGLNLSQQIYKIEDVNVNVVTPSNLATKLGLAISATPRVSDILTIILDDNQKFSFKFTGQSSGSSANGSPDYKNQEFNNFDTLSKAISYATRDQIEAVIDNSNNRIDLKTTTKSLTKIFSITSTAGLGSFMGLDAQSRTLDFIYSTANVPNISSGEFNSIPTLIEAMKKLSNDVLQPSILNGIMTISVKNGGSINFIRNKNVLGSSNLASDFGLEGYNPLSAFGLNDIASVSGRRFNKLSDLPNLLNKSMPMQTSIVEAGKVVMNANSVLDKFTMKNFKASSSNTGSVSEISDFLGVFGVGKVESQPLYIASDELRNMSSSNVKGHFSSNVVDLYDSLGIKHTLISNFMKIANNEWVMEISAKPEETTSLSGRTDGLLGYATIKFDGDGILQSLQFTNSSGSQSSSIQDGYPLQINWNDGASPSTINLGFGNNVNARNIFGKNNGLFTKQVSSDYFFSSRRDGSGSGTVTGIDISENGSLSMHFSDGDIREMYKIPIVMFPNYNGLTLLEGNVYTESDGSGKGQLHLVGNAGSGKIRSKNLESANVEVLTELTAMIPTQHAYYANSKVIQTITKMLDELRKLE